MKETRFFYVPDAATETEMPMDEALHALRVLRIKSGDEMFLMDGVGNFYCAEVTLAATKRCMYEVKEVMPQQPAWRGHVHLAIAPTKMMDRIEWMAEKATEVGFNELSFLNSQFSERKVMRTVRLDKIIVSAVKQSHKAWKPIVNQMVNFRDFINTPRKGRKFICHCYEEIEKKDLFTELTKACPDEDADVTVLIGPEGDFSIDEVRMAVKAGYESVTLGTSRLRTETAGLVAVTMANLARRL
jgi:16S rRNA (uracil1498-N3)-methyltransferase